MKRVGYEDLSTGDLKKATCDKWCPEFMKTFDSAPDKIKVWIESKCKPVIEANGKATVELTKNSCSIKFVKVDGGSGSTSKSW
mmetsp:Transcript_25782/g.56838  ORF Transcript_25782/g.56838 Transcript_25782/m.56838 type:complete len:83 (-) Transcript_25782:213-461(-)